MSGQQGFPPGQGGPNPWAQQAAPWGPQGQGFSPGAPGAAPFRTPAVPDGEITMEEVELPWPVNTVPNACACCNGPAQSQLLTQSTAQIGRTTQTRSLQVPYCARCAEHVRAGGRRGSGLGFLGFFVALPVPLALMLLWDYAPWFVVIPAATLGALGALAMLEALWKAKPVAREQGCHACEQPAFWMQSFAFNGPTVKFRAVNPRWMEQLARTYNARPARIGPQKPGRARWVAAPLCATLAAIPLWFAMHGHVYFDNPSNDTLVFDVDDGCETVTVLPGAHADMWLPSGNTRVAVRRGAQTVETIRGEVGHWSTHAVTPLGITCYGVQQRAYGTAHITGRGFEPAPEGLRWHTLEHIGLVFEPFPRSVSVGRGQTGSIRRRFGRVNCGYGSAY